jgi:hypothetical protein
VDDRDIIKLYLDRDEEAIAETRVIHGVEVQIARQQPSLRAEYWYYAIFKYDGVVYDLRTLSNDAGYVDEVLERMLGELD